MSALGKLINTEVRTAVAFVAVGFLSLKLFLDMVDELQWIGRFGNDYKFQHAAQFALLQVPSNLYELLPICVLIGTIFVMARMAQSSEFTILRTSGLGPWRALKQLALLGVLFSVLTLVLGDYVAPAADRMAQLIKAKHQGKLTTGLTGAWLREKQAYTTFSVNVASMDGDTTMVGVRVFEFDAKGAMVSMMQAQTARFGDDDAWQLANVRRTDFLPPDKAGQSPALIERAVLPSMRWPTGISSDKVAAALLKPEHMGTLDLYTYMRHLDANGQESQRFEIQFWRKVFYPLSCLVMVVMALPFAYLHFRSGSITGYVFLGVMIGISFYLLNNMFGFIGNISQWEPWIAASAPSILYLVASLAGFTWLVLRR